MSDFDAFAAHQQRTKHDEANKNINSNSKLHIWALNDGVKFFVRCVVNAGEPNTGEDWPRVWAGNESKVVNCAVFTQAEDTTFQLVAVWALSTGIQCSACMGRLSWKCICHEHRIEYIGT
jgi:hypothetical protein